MKLDNRIWFALTILVCAALVVGGYFLGVAPQLASASAAEQQTQSVQSQNTALQTQLSTLQLEAKNEATTSAELAVLRQKIPVNFSESAVDFVSQVNAIIAATKVQMTTIGFSAATPYKAPTAPAAASSSTTSGSSSTDSGGSATTGSSSAETAAVQAATLAIPHTDKLVTPASLVVVPVTLAVSGTRAEVIAFITAVHSLSRLVLVTGVTMGQQGTGTTYTVQLTGDIFLAKS